MIAAIFDIVASRDVDIKERKRLDGVLRRAMNHTYDRFKEHSPAVPALTQGDSIELLVDSWEPIVYLCHRLLMEDLEFRVGLGTGSIVIQKESADECDGPAFWNAREALNKIKSKKYKSRPAGFKVDEESTRSESNAVVRTLLFFMALLGLSTTQLQHCYFYLWEDKSISEIAETTGTSKGNVSKTLSKTPCYLLDDLLRYLTTDARVPHVNT
jgi:hypothetical protein